MGDPDVLLVELFPYVFLIVGATIFYFVLKNPLKRVIDRVRSYFRNQSITSVEENIEYVASHHLQLAPFHKPSVNDIHWSNVLSFTLNGQKIEIVNPNPSELLVTYIRESASLTGTKIGCGEGGCGACTVMVEDGEGKIKAINSCLRLLCAVDGLNLTTVEGIGSVKIGLSEEQQSIVQTNATQCGYCTPGWVTAMHALVEDHQRSGTSLEKKDIERNFDGNLCRCTGYRPIMKAFHGLCDSKTSIQQTCNENAVKYHCSDKYNPAGKFDIEDYSPYCPAPESKFNTVKPSNKRSNKPKASVKPLYFYNETTKKKYFRPVTVDQLAVVLQEYAASAHIVRGNSTIGVTKYLNDSAPYYLSDTAEVYVDVGAIPELSEVKFTKESRTITIGAAVTINEVISHLRENMSAEKNTVQKMYTLQDDGEVNYNSMFSVVANHLQKVANTQVRNAGSWAGNVMMTMKYPSFASDVVLALLLADATVTVSSAHQKHKTQSMRLYDLLYSVQYNKFMHDNSFIVSMTLRDTTAADNCVISTLKIAEREHNAHALMDAAFYFKLAPAQVYGNTVSAPYCLETRVIYGAVAKTIFVAQETQSVLAKNTLDTNTFARALQALQRDWQKAGIADPSPYSNYDFLNSSMQAALYQAILRCYPATSIDPSALSLLLPWTKGISRGVEVFPMLRDASISASAANYLRTSRPTNVRGDDSTDPVHKPVQKLEAPTQATGEAIYPSDVALPAGRSYHGVLYYSSECNKTLASLDFTAAKSVAGVVAIFSAADIPGNNDLLNNMPLFIGLGEVVPYVGAPLAVIIASNYEAATRAIPLIHASYTSPAAATRPSLAHNGKFLKKNLRQQQAGQRRPVRDANSAPIVTIDQAIAKNSFFTDVGPPATNITVGDAQQALQNAQFQLSGTVDIGGQYHFYMEAQSAVASVVDGNVVKVVCGSQDVTAYQDSIANILAVPTNQVIVQCPRTGGGFGGKIRGGLFASAAAALASYKLNASVKVSNIFNRAHDMMMQGGREEWRANYQIGFDSSGAIQSIVYDFVVDAGSSDFEASGGAYMGMCWADNAYFFPSYLANAKLAKTNTPGRTSMRAPGVVTTCLISEMLLERIAVYLRVPMHVVQEKNFIRDGQTTIVQQTIENSTLQQVWQLAKDRSKFLARLQTIEQFNAKNRFRKRGISIAPVKYGMGWGGYNAAVSVHVRSSDGSVIVRHNGAELGQGINTKVAQAVAGQLHIDLSLIRVEGPSTDVIANGGTTGGSGTSEVVVQASINACNTLNDRLAPYQKTRNLRSGQRMTKDAWLSLLHSLPTEVSLNVEGWFSPSENPNKQPFQYFVYAAAVCEVELDVVTGRVHVLATDIVYDNGSSLNPAVDIGQIEGAFVMGLGLLFQEKVNYDSLTGSLLTVGTWEYKPLFAQDIPTTFNVMLLADSYNSAGILGSKATGEPPYIIANAAYFAAKMAIASARADAGETGFFYLPVPATVSERQKACLVNASTFKLPA